MNNTRGRTKNWWGNLTNSWYACVLGPATISTETLRCRLCSPLTFVFFESRGFASLQPSMDRWLNTDFVSGKAMLKFERVLWISWVSVPLAPSVVRKSFCDGTVRWSISWCSIAGRYVNSKACLIMENRRLRKQKWSWNRSYSVKLPRPVIAFENSMPVVT